LAINSNNKKVLSTLALEKKVSTKISDWYANATGYLDPPGCKEVIVPHPKFKNNACNIGIVHEHRFAFYFWGLYAIDKKRPNAPILITLDSHKDIGALNDVIPEDLNNLDLSDRKELGLFTWLRLHPHNDGHIRPALYLNFFSNVYALLNKDGGSCEFDQSATEAEQEDREHRQHLIRFYSDIEKLLRDIPSECPIYLDIDLDFFANNDPNANRILGAAILKSDDEIISILSINGALMKSTLDRIAGITIALEPRYCGGILNSLHVLDILNQEMFSGTLCTNTCKWKERAIK